MVDSGSRHGSNEFAAAGIVGLFSGLQMRENAAEGRKMPFIDGHCVPTVIIQHI